MGFLRRQTTLAELVLQNFIFTNCNPTLELPFQDNFRLFVTKISFYVVIAESFLLQKASTFWKKKSLTYVADSRAIQLLGHEFDSYQWHLTFFFILAIPDLTTYCLLTICS